MASQTNTEAAIEFVKKNGLGAAIALFLVWWLTNDIAGTVRQTRDELREHSFVTTHILHQLCVINATQAGIPEKFCDPPEQQHK